MKRKPKKLPKPKPIRAWAIMDGNGNLFAKLIYCTRMDARCATRDWICKDHVIPVEIRPLRSSPTTLERIGRESLKMYARYGCGDWPYGPSMRKLMQLCQSVDNRPLRKKVRRG